MKNWKISGHDKKKESKLKRRKTNKLQNQKK